MATATPLVEDKRRSESDAAVRHRAHVIHASVGGPRDGGISAPVRQTVRARAEQAGLSAKVTRRLVELLARLETPEAQKVALRLIQARTFTALESALQDFLIARLTRRRADPAYLQKVGLCLQQPGLAELDASTRRLAIRAMTAEDLLVVRQLPELLACPGLSALTAGEQRDVLGYFIGPRLARGIAPMRKNRMRLMWNGKRQDLLIQLRNPRFRRGSPDDQADTLRSFLHEPTQPLHVLNATSLNGHAVMIFGAPDDRRAMSYGRRWVAARGGGWPQARLYAPDPTVNSGWTKPAMDARTPYAGRCYRLCRLEAWRLIELDREQLRGERRPARNVGLGPGGSRRRASSTSSKRSSSALVGLVADPSRAQGHPWRLPRRTNPHDATRSRRTMR